MREIVLAVLALLVVEIGCRSLAIPQMKSLAFPPHQTVEYKARDFEFVSRTNELGFRGPEFPVAKRDGVTRILVLGNSFAYGWGVDFKDTWPHLLEEALQRDGLRVEVANLATPGTTPRLIGGIAEKSIPVLRPDLVIIAALQGAAVTTFQWDAPEQERPRNIRTTLGDLVGAIAPGMISALQRAKDATTSGNFIPSMVAKTEWKKQAEAFTRQMTAEQRDRIEAINKATIDRFLAGELNSPLVIQAARDPLLFESAVRDHGLCELAKQGMAFAFGRVTDVAKTWSPGVRVIVVSMPYAAYQGDRVADVVRNVGFHISTDIANGGAGAEECIASAAAGSGLAMVSVVKQFREAATSQDFIPFDGHYSPTGTRLFADLVVPLIESQIASSVRIGSK